MQDDNQVSDGGPRPIRDKDHGAISDTNSHGEVPLQYQSLAIEDVDTTKQKLTGMPRPHGEVLFLAQLMAKSLQQDHRPLNLCMETTDQLDNQNVGIHNLSSVASSTHSSQHVMSLNNTNLGITSLFDNPHNQAHHVNCPTPSPAPNSPISTPNTFKLDPSEPTSTNPAQSPPISLSTIPETVFPDHFLESSPIIPPTHKRKIQPDTDHPTTQKPKIAEASTATTYSDPKQMTIIPHSRIEVYLNSEKSHNKNPSDSVRIRPRHKKSIRRFLKRKGASKEALLPQISSKNYYLIEAQLTWGTQATSLLGGTKDRGEAPLESIWIKLLQVQVGEWLFQKPQLSTLVQLILIITLC
ncbi:hypothetical protein FCV25MIE_16359 [Fagus crenata]